MEAFTKEYISKELLNSRQEWVYTYLYNKYFPRLSRYINSRVDDNLYIEDIIQEAFINVWYRAGVQQDFTSEVHFRSYLFTVVRHLVFKYWKRNFRYVKTQTEVVQQDFFRDVAAADTIRTLYGFLKPERYLIPPEMAKVLLRYYIRDYRYAEIADELGISQATVHDYLKRGRPILTQLFTTGRRSESSASNGLRPPHILYRKAYETLLQNIDISIEDLAATIGKPVQFAYQQRKAIVDSGVLEEEIRASENRKKVLLEVLVTMCAKYYGIKRGVVLKEVKKSIALPKARKVAIFIADEYELKYRLDLAKYFNCRKKLISDNRRKLIPVLESSADFRNELTEIISMSGLPKTPPSIGSLEAYSTNPLESAPA